MRNILSIFLILPGTFIAHAQPFRAVPEESAPATFSVRILDEAGTTVFRIQREQYRDAAPPALHVFENGSVLLVDGYAGVLEYYTQSGRLERSIPIRGSIKPEHERVIQSAGTGTLAAFLVSEPNEPDVLVLLIDADGRILLRKPLSTRVHASGLALTPDGELLAAGSYRWDATTLVHTVDVFRADGTLIRSVNAEMRRGWFNSDQSLLLATGASSASILDARTGEILVQKQFSRGSVIHDAMWDKQEGSVAVSPAPVLDERAWIYPSLSVHALSVDGVTQESTTISTPFTTARFKREAETIGIELDGRPEGRN